MSVSTTDAGVIRLGNGATTVFPFSFPARTQTDIKVGEITTNTVTPIAPANYVVALAPGGAGGTVTFNTAPLTGVSLYIFRETSLTQLVSVSSQLKYDPIVVENVWDKLTFIAQELASDVALALKVAPGEDPVLLLTNLYAASDAAVQAALAAQAWATGTTPGGPGTLSAREEADRAEQSADKVPLYFPDRATAEVGQTSGTQRITVDDLDYVYDAAGTALTTGDGRKWMPRHIIKSEPIYAAHFGVRGSDNVIGLIDEAAPLRRALQAAVATGSELILPHTMLRIDTALDMAATGKVLRISGAGGGTHFVAGQSLADTGGVAIRADGNTWAVPSGSTTLAANANIGDQRWKLNTVAGLEVGMMINLSSNIMWYYDARGIWNKGETHIITRIFPLSNEVEIDGFTFDSYNVLTETTIVMASLGTRLIAHNLSFEFPGAGYDVSVTALVSSNGINDEVGSIRAKGPSLCGVAFRRCIRPQLDGFYGDTIGYNAMGYGVSVVGGKEGRYTNLRGRSMRRLIDFGGIGGTAASVTRTGLVDGFHVDGGGVEARGAEYWPDVSPSYPRNYGVGTHGPAEFIKFANGFITGVWMGVISRSRQTSFDNIQFNGNMFYCVGGYYGAGLSVTNCSYDKGAVPERAATEDRLVGARTFATLGGRKEDDTGGFGGMASDLPVVFSDITALGLKNSFLDIPVQTVFRGLELRNIDCQITSATGSSSFSFIRTPYPSDKVNLVDANIQNNKMRRLSFDGGTVELHSNGITLGGTIDGSDVACRLDGSYTATINDDTAIRIAGNGLTTALRYVRVYAHADVNIYYEGLLSAGGITKDNIKGSGIDLGTTALTGTTGVDGKVTVSRNALGDVYIENRSGTNRRFFVSIS